jgi:hypothetical protein
MLKIPLFTLWNNDVIAERGALMTSESCLTSTESDGRLTAKGSGPLGLASYFISSAIEGSFDLCQKKQKQRTYVFYVE